MFSVNQHRFTEINDNEFMRDERTIKYNLLNCKFMYLQFYLLKIHYLSSLNSVSIYSQTQRAGFWSPRQCSGSE